MASSQPTQLWQLDATDLAGLIRTGRASAREAVQSCLDRMAAVNPAINAVIQPMEAEALAAAEAADAARASGAALGALHGVPVTIKVNIDQKGHATTNGVVAYRDMVAPGDSPVVANFRTAGAVIIGRTNVPAFSMRGFTENDLHGRTLNPRDPAITPGGSSGGAGAAVATGIGPIAHGNDIAGSVRIPAYCCGVIGLRTGYGRVAAHSSFGPVPRPIGAQLMSTQGPLTRSVRDARLALQVMAMRSEIDAQWVDAPLTGPRPVGPIRVALMPNPPGGFTHPAQQEAVREAGRRLQAAGYAVEEIEAPDFAETAELWHRIGFADIFQALGPLIEQEGGEAARISLRLWQELAPPARPEDLSALLMRRHAILQKWGSFLARHPLLVLPTMADLPPPQGQDLTLEGQRAFLDSFRVGLPVSVLGLPGLAVPVGSHGALRTGVQIVAWRYREDLCLDAGEVVADPVGPIDPVGS